jgi:hypothetical protein
VASPEWKFSDVRFGKKALLHSPGEKQKANPRHLLRVKTPGGAAMFIRFVVPSRDEDSQCRMGVFQAADRLRYGGRLSVEEKQRLDDILLWFNGHLPTPGRFSRSRRRDARGEAVCWFRDGAARYIGRVRELAALLERHGIPVEMLRTGRPGYVVYEDSYQVVAVPFRGTRA